MRLADTQEAGGVATAAHATRQQALDILDDLSYHAALDLRGADRIDGMPALLRAIDIRMRHGDEGSVYDYRGLAAVG